MAGLLSAKKRWPIALDIGTESIKMLQLGQSGGRLFARAAQRWQFPDPGDPDPVRRGELTVAGISEMLRRGRFRGNRVVSCLACRQLSIKNIRLPRMPAAELPQAIIWEAAERFSFDVSPDTLKFLNAGQVRQGSEVRDEIILLGVPQETVAEHLDTLAHVGLVPEAIDAEPLALFRAFERCLRRRTDEDNVSVVIDIGYSGTCVVVARGRNIVFVKWIDIGGRRLTDAIASQLDLTYEEASELRSRNMRSPSEDSEKGSSGAGQDRTSLEWTIHDSVRGEVEALAREISLCLRYCSVTFRGLRPKDVMLVGGETYDRSMLDLLAGHLGVECEVGQPFQGIDMSRVDLGADRRSAVAEWSLCVGLAMRGADGSALQQEDDHEPHRLSA